jgi:hypothetical protein
VRVRYFGEPQDPARHHFPPGSNELDAVILAFRNNLDCKIAKVFGCRFSNCNIPEWIFGVQITCQNGFISEA